MRTKIEDTLKVTENKLHAMKIPKFGNTVLSNYFRSRCFPEHCCSGALQVTFQQRVLSVLRHWWYNFLPERPLQHSDQGIFFPHTFLSLVFVQAFVLSLNHCLIARCIRALCTIDNIHKTSSRYSLLWYSFIEKGCRIIPTEFCINSFLHTRIIIYAKPCIA